MKFKLSLAAVAASLALGVAAPASAQGYGRHHGYDHPYAERSAYQLERLHYVLRDGVRSGAVSRREARRLFPELRYLSDLRERYIYTRGMSEREAYDLRSRIGAFRDDVREAVWDGHGYGQYRDGDYRDRDWQDRDGRDDRRYDDD